jgi:hypothetical protein
LPQAYKDEEKKRQINSTKEKLKKPPPTQSQSQTEKDEETKRRIKEQLKKPPPPLLQSNKDEDTKNQIEASLQRPLSVAQTSTSSQVDRAAKMKRQVKEQLASGTFTVEMSATSRNAEDSELSTNCNMKQRSGDISKTNNVFSEGRPGAVPVQQRAVGNRPAWVQPSSYSGEQYTASSDSNLPPEMRGVVQNSNLPPEIRAVPPESAGESSPDDGMIPAAEVTAILINEKPEFDASDIRHTFWVYVGVSVVVVLIIIAVAAGVAAGGGGGSSDEVAGQIPAMPVATENPSSSPTIFVGYRCLEYEDLLNYVHPNINGMNDDVKDFYMNFLEGTPLPVTKEEHCSPAHLATVWLANKFANTTPNTTVTNQFALAALYFNWAGQGDSANWLQNSDECTWKGVECDSMGRIVGLKLSLEALGRDTENMNLLPTEIGLLTDLSTLSVTSLWLCVNLFSERLYLTHCQQYCFCGRILETALQ